METSKTGNRKEVMKMWKLAILATLATLASGCYIGKAEFKGEDMKMYPFFGTAAAPMDAAR